MGAGVGGVVAELAGVVGTGVPSCSSTGRPGGAGRRPCPRGPTRCCSCWLVGLAVCGGKWPGVGGVVAVSVLCRLPWHWICVRWKWDRPVRTDAEVMWPMWQTPRVGMGVRATADLQNWCGLQNWDKITFASTCGLAFARTFGFALGIPAVVMSAALVRCPCHQIRIRQIGDGPVRTYAEVMRPRWQTVCVCTRQ